MRLIDNISTFRLKFKSILAFVIIMLGAVVAQASHIVGGELKYKCLGDDLYEISLIVYRDCENANPDAVFDDPAVITLFDVNGDYIKDAQGLYKLLQLPLLSVETFNDNFGCDNAANKVCYEKATYKKVVKLSRREGGYHMVYQRCCRNKTLTNVVDPLNVGTSLTTYLSDFAMDECNSSPEIGDFPDIFVCVNESFSIPQTAIDADGDSLVYSLEIPFAGARRDKPVPVPAFPLPLERVQFLSPTFSAENMMGGDDSFTINETTGVLTATPTLLGQFLVGYKVSEYRDGKLLSELHREFEINVVDCEGAPQAIIDGPELVCNSLTGTFKHKSKRASDITWILDTDNPSTTTFKEDSPTFTYPKGGIYNIMLVATNEKCSDTTRQQVAILNTGDDIPVDYTFNCNSKKVDFRIDGNLKFDEISWEFGDTSTTTDVSTESTPSYTYPEKGTYTVTLTAKRDDCSLIKRFDVRVVSVDEVLEDTLGVCSGNKVVLNPEAHPAFTYSWSPADVLDDANAISPIANIDKDTVFKVRVSLKNDPDCYADVDYVVLLNMGDFTGALAGTESGTVVCKNASIYLNPDGAGNYVYSWAPAEYLNDANARNPKATITEDQVFTVRIADSNDETCYTTKEILIKVGNDNLYFLSDTISACPGQTVALNPTGFGGNQYTWRPKELLDDHTKANPLYEVTQDQLFMVRISRGSCVGDFDKFVRSDSLLGMPKFAVKHNCTNTKVDLINVAMNMTDPKWYFDGKLIGRGDRISYDFMTSGKYLVELRLGEGNTVCNSVSDEVIIINPLDPIAKDSLYLCEPGEVSLNPDGDPRFVYEWDNGHLLDDPTSYNPTASVTETTVFKVNFVDKTDETCKFSDEVAVLVGDNPDLIINDNTQICMDDNIVLRTRDIDADEFKWYDPDGELVSTAKDFTIELMKAGKYVFTAKRDGASCTFTDTVKLYYRDMAIELMGNLTPCPGDEVQLRLVNKTDFDIQAYSWSPRDIIVDGQGSDVVTVKLDSSMMISAIVRFEDGCRAEVRDTIRISEMLRNIAVSAEPDTILFGESSTLSMTQVDGVTYRWEPSEFVLDPNAAQTEVRPPRTTTFTLIALDINGCQVTRDVTVVVLDPKCEPPYIFIPRAFSPNGDGKNDELCVRGQFIEEMTFIIYDRWGQKVFESTNPDICWDGTFRGEKLPPDVYGYYVSIKCPNGLSHQEKGNITIVR